MVENRNEKCNNNFIWNQFLAELDVKTIKSGEAYNIQSWPTLQMFSGEVYYRLHLPVSGKFRVVYPGNLYLIPSILPLKLEGIEPYTHCWIHFVSKQLQTIPMLRYPQSTPLENPGILRKKFEDVYRTMKTCDSFADAVMIKNTVTELLVPFLEKISGHLPDSVLSLSEFMKVVDYIDLQLKRNIEIAELSALLGMSRAEFSASFRKVFGVPPKQYISIRRLFQALSRSRRSPHNADTAMSSSFTASSRNIPASPRQNTGNTPATDRIGRNKKGRTLRPARRRKKFFFLIPYLDSISNT